MSIRPAVAPPDLPAPQMREGSRSLVDRHTKVDGTMQTPQDLRVEGQVSGTLRCDGVLYVASGAEVDADVTATDAIVEGTVAGSIACSGRLEVRSTGVIRANVKTQRLVIHEGAILEGRLDMETVAAPEDSDDAGSTPEQPASAASPTPEPSSSYSYLRSFSTPGASSAAEDSDLPGREAPADDEDEEDDQT